MNSELYQLLLNCAKEQADRAYCPYSEFPVGAVVYSVDTVYRGNNVEVASYGLTICAERVAISSMVAAGKKKIDILLIYTPTEFITSPCGACRQFIYEFSDSNTVIISVNKSGTQKVWRVSDLLPDAFGPRSLKEKHKGEGQ